MCIYVFKQKTAYERRISDWSSDVCSSDLSRRLTSGCIASPRAISTSRRFTSNAGRPQTPRIEEGWSEESPKARSRRIERKASQPVHAECRIERKASPPVHATRRIEKTDSPPVHAERRTHMRPFEAPAQLLRKPS